MVLSIEPVAMNGCLCIAMKMMTTMVMVVVYRVVSGVALAC
jgi:hypothetical protein